MDGKVYVSKAGKVYDQPAVLGAWVVVQTPNMQWPEFGTLCQSQKTEKHGFYLVNPARKARTGSFFAFGRNTLPFAHSSAAK